jgi:plastocyanin
MGKLFLWSKAHWITLLLSLALLLSACGGQSSNAGKSGNSGVAAGQSTGSNASSALSSAGGKGMAQPVGTAPVSNSGGTRVVIKLVAKKGAQGMEYSFEPASITIKVGTTVEWINLSDESQLLSSNEVGLFTAASKLVKNGSYQQTFNRPGIYVYFSKEHPTAKGTITVIA